MLGAIRGLASDVHLALQARADPDTVALVHNHDSDARCCLGEFEAAFGAEDEHGVVDRVRRGGIFSPDRHAAAFGGGVPGAWV